MTSTDPQRTTGTETPVPEEKPAPWRNFLAVYAVLLLVGAETFLVSPLLPTIAEVLRVSEADAAMAVNAYVLTYAVTAPFLGTVTDRFGRRGSILAGTTLFAAGNVVAAFAPSLGVLITARAIGGLGAALTGPAIWAHIGDTAAPSVRGRAMGLGMASFSLGQVVGIPAGGLIAGLLSWRASFGAIAILTALSLPVLFWTVRAKPAAKAAPVPVKVALREPFRLWGLSIPAHALAVTFLLQAASLGSYAYLGVVLHARYDLSVSELGLVGILVGVGSVLGAVLGGRIGDRARSRGQSDASRLVLWSVLLGSGVVVAAGSGYLPLALFGVLAWFFASGAFVTDQQTLLANAAPTMRATASSWNTSTMHLGTAIGVWVVGSFASVPTGVLITASIVAAAAAVTAAFLQLRLYQVNRRKPAPQ